MNATLPLITDPEQVRELLTSAPMPAVAPAGPPAGLAWLRAHVPRFCDGAEHRQLRALVEAELAEISPAQLRTQAQTSIGPFAHVEVLAQALGLHDISVSAVALVATSYLPYQPDDPAADQAVAELVGACGGVADEATAARICLLVQACHSTAALITNARQLADAESHASPAHQRANAQRPGTAHPLADTPRHGSSQQAADAEQRDAHQPPAAGECTNAQPFSNAQHVAEVSGHAGTQRHATVHPDAGQPESVDDLLARTLVANSPIRRTRRVVNGEVFELDMTQGGLGFGAGPHACPGRAHALALAAGILERDK